MSQFVRWQMQCCNKYKSTIQKRIGKMSAKSRNKLYEDWARDCGAGCSHENMLMLCNCAAACRAVGHLQHIGLVTGGKIYGMHFHPSMLPGHQLPHIEDTSRGPPPNFYLDQEDFVKSHPYTIARPSFILGTPPPGCWKSSSLSLGVVLAAYCAMLHCRGDGRLPFPGSTQNCDARLQLSSALVIFVSLRRPFRQHIIIITSSSSPHYHHHIFISPSDSHLLDHFRPRRKDIAHVLTTSAARSAAGAGGNSADTTPRMHQEAFNIVSCRLFSWREVWPRFVLFCI